MADDFRIKQGFTGHFKTIKLRRRCGADGVLAFIDLIDFCSRTDGRETGSLDGMDDDDVEIAAKWNGERGALVATLTEVGYLDGEPGAYRVHQFQEHNPHVASAPQRKAAAQKAIHTRWLKEKGVCVYGGDSPWCDAYCAKTTSVIRHDTNSNTDRNTSRNTPLPSPPPPSSPSTTTAKVHKTEAVEVHEIEEELSPWIGLLTRDRDRERIVSIARQAQITRGELDDAKEIMAAQAQHPCWQFLITTIGRKRNAVAKKADGARSFKGYKQATENSTQEVGHYDLI